MTRKDYILIARTIQSLEADGFDAGARLAIAKAFAETLRTDNPQFKADLFIRAATGQCALTARK
jgi:hypothetical protein